jgi:C-22 sterol desaturase
MHIAAVIGSAALSLDWRHEITDQSEEIKIIATIFPQDECLLQFTPVDVTA